MNKRQFLYQLMFFVCEHYVVGFSFNRELTIFQTVSEVYVSSIVQSIAVYKVATLIRSLWIFHPSPASPGVLFKKSDFRLTYSPGLRFVFVLDQEGGHFISNIYKQKEDSSLLDPIDPLYCSLCLFFTKDCIDFSHTYTYNDKKNINY